MTSGELWEKTMYILSNEDIPLEHKVESIADLYHEYYNEGGEDYVLTLDPEEKILDERDGAFEHLKNQLIMPDRPEEGEEDG